MNPNLHVRSIVRKYHVVHGPNSPAFVAARTLFPILRAWAGKFLLSIQFSGSTAKGTSIRGSTDIDLFISLKPETHESLAEIYENLFAYLTARGVPAKRQDVSIGVDFKGLSVDLVPAKKQRGNASDHSLYRNKADTWVQTNVERHIRIIKASDRLNEIRAVKIWRMLHRLDFPSFYLEMSVLAALYQKPKYTLAPNFLSVLEYLRDDLEDSVINDPANTNNCLSDLLSSAEKRAIGVLAGKHLKKTWSEVLW